MRILLRLALFVYLFLVFASSLWAQNLDIFNTSKPFSLDRLPPGKRWVDLAHLTPEDIPDHLPGYLKSLRRAQGPVERNLLALAGGYLYLRQGDEGSALRVFKNYILGNFILDDFRLHFEALAFQRRAQKKLEEKKYFAALADLKKSLRRRLSLFQAWPTSPFQVSLPRDLAETERLLGDAYYQVFNYKAAWQMYRRALMREFPDNETHKREVNLALARTYTAAGELFEAGDIYIALLKEKNGPDVQAAAEKFIRDHKGKLRDQPAVYRELTRRLKEAKRAETSSREKIVAQKPPGPLGSDNPEVQAFYEALGEDDPEKILERGYAILKKYPGIRETRNVVPILNRMIVDRYQSFPLPSLVHRLIELYPAETLSDLGYAYWKINRPDHAALFYKKILSKYPLDISMGHKSAYFLGRIYEDKRQFAESLEHYRRVRDKYDYGPYTAAALFKISWVERIQGNYDQARTHFKELISFYDSPLYRELKAVWPASASYRAATHYWLAQTEKALGDQDAHQKRIQTLIRLFPFDFYSIFSRSETALKEFLTGDPQQELELRQVGLGVVERKRLSRAEKLIAAGFLSFGAQELAEMTAGRDNPAFVFYLSHLFKRAGDFQKSILLSWNVVARDGNGYLSRDLVEVLFPQAFREQVVTTAREYRIDPLFALSLMRQESAFNPKITSSANAVGLMQLLPTTAAHVARSLKQEAPSEDQLKEPETNIQLGMEYLNAQLETFNRNLIYVLAAYNAGPEKVKEWVALRNNLSPMEFIESIPYNETRGYVKNVLRNYAVYLALYDHSRIRPVKEWLTISRE